MGQTKAVNELGLIFSNRTWFKSAYFKVLRKKYFHHLDYIYGLLECDFL